MRFFMQFLKECTNIQIDTNLGKSPDYTLCVFYCSRFFFQKFPIRWDFIIFLKHTLSFPILLIKLFFKTAVPLPHIVEIHALSMPTKWGIQVCNLIHSSSFCNKKSQIISYKMGKFNSNSGFPLLGNKIQFEINSPYCRI